MLILGAARVGKSLASAMEAVAWAPHSELIWLTAEKYENCRAEFEYVMQALLDLGWTRQNRISFPLNQYQPCSLECVFPCVVETRSLGELAKQMVAKAPDLIIACEPALISSDPLERFWERLSTKRGRLWMAGTLEDEVGTSWLRATFKRWRQDNDEFGRAFSVPLFENTVSFPGGEKNREIRRMKRIYRHSTYMERVLGIPAPPELLVFKDVFRDGSTKPFHRRHLRFNRDKPVYLAVDPGFFPSWAWCGAIQLAGPHEEIIHVIDEVTGQNMTQSELIQEAMLRPWWKNVPSAREGTAGTIDPYAGRSHIFGAASPQEVWLKEADVYLSAQIRPTISDLIQRHRYYLQNPSTGECRLFYDAGCTRLEFEYGHWKNKKDDEGKAVANAPLDRHCDAMKGLGYYLVYHYSQRSFRVPQPSARPAVRDWVPV